MWIFLPTCSIWEKERWTVVTIWLEFLWKHFAKGSTAWDEQLSVQQLFLTPTSNNPKVQCKAEILFFTFLFVEKKTCGGLARASFSLFALSLEIASATNLSCSNHTFTFSFIQNTFTFCVPSTLSFAVLPLIFNFLLIQNTFPFTQPPNYYCNPHMIHQPISLTLTFGFPNYQSNALQPHLHSHLRFSNPHDATRYFHLCFPSVLPLLDPHNDDFIFKVWMSNDLAFRCQWFWNQSWKYFFNFWLHFRCGLQEFFGSRV